MMVERRIFLVLKCIFERHSNAIFVFLTGKFIVNVLLTWVLAVAVAVTVTVDVTVAVAATTAVVLCDLLE